MTQVSVREAETRLANLIRAAREGEDVVIMDGDEPIARIVSVTTAKQGKSSRRTGSGKGRFIVEPDFDAPLKDNRVNDDETLSTTGATTSDSELQPIQPTSGSPRPFGLCAGQFIVPDDFDAPLPEDVIPDFEGE